MRSSRIASFLAGMVFANSLPHLASALTGRQHLTPLAGRGSGPAINGIWAALNVGAGIALLQPSRRRGGRRWGRELTAFGCGSATLAAWMAISEGIWQVNSDHH